MIVECPKCHKKYEIDEMYIPIGGAPIRCPNCKNIFGIYVEPIDIPMTEVSDENIPSSTFETPVEESKKPSFEENSISTQFEEKKVEESEIPTFPDMDQFGKFSSEAEEIPFSSKKTSFEPKVEEVKKEEPFVNPFAQPQPQKPVQQPPFQQPDFGVPPAFTQPKVEEVKKEEPFVNPFAQPQRPLQQPTQTVQAGKAGSPMFDVLLAGFNLPPDFKSLPENVQKLHKDAIKLARQLAKDILLYHKDEVERGLTSGNIKEVLKEEIEKSYKFYSQRIPAEIVNSTNYFNEALNKIICKGQNIF
ncbi:MAG: zinc-ribbon domain-containing protein [candidate division WOR-3 bacterium]